MEFLLDEVVQLLQVPVGEPLRGVEPQRQSHFRHIEDLEQEIQHLLVMDFSGQLGLQNIMWNAVKEMMDVHFQNILHVLRVSVNPLLDDLLGFVGASSRNTCVGMGIHTPPEHIFHSHDHTMLDDQLFQCGHNDGTVFMPDTVLNDHGRVLRVFVVDDPLKGECQHIVIRQVAPFQHFSDAFRALGLLDSPTAVFLRDTDVKQVFVCRIS